MATTTRKDLPIWARPRPGKLGATQPLTAAQKRKAKARADAAGRKYPNLIDNIAAARNPTMKKPSPAQLAARKRFAEMARSGAFKKKATRRKANPVDTFIEKFHLGGKIYAQIIEKSDGTFDYYVYQMQATGIPGEKPYEQFFDSKNYKTKSGAMRGLEKWAMRHQYKVTPQLHTNPAKKTVSQKISQLRHEGYPQRQAVAVALSEQRAGKVKRNPMGEIQAYAITRNFKVLGIFQTKQDAIKAAQGISDATGKTLAIKPVQVMAGHFNK